MDIVHRVVLGCVTAAMCVNLGAPVAVAAPDGRGAEPPRQCFDERPAMPKDPDLLVPEGLDVPPEEAGSTGDGSNNLSFAQFRDGDIVVAMESLSVGHAGIWDARYATGDRSLCVWSAVKSVPACVLREAPVRYRTYDKAFGLYVPGVAAATRALVRTYCAAQNGEPYDISSSKTNESRWYCSKLVWAGYFRRANRDIDANGGYWVSPADIYSDNDTVVFAAGN